jgi:hypothetical protein
MAIPAKLKKFSVYLTQSQYDALKNAAAVREISYIDQLRRVIDDWRDSSVPSTVVRHASHTP